MVLQKLGYSLAAALAIVQTVPAQSDQEVMNALLAKLYEVMTAPDKVNANATARKISSSSAPPFICFCSPGVAVESLDFGELLTVDQVNRCARFSQTVNAIPAPGGLYVPTNTKVWSIYNLAITDINLPLDPPEVSEAEHKMLKRAEDFLRSEVQTKDPFTEEVKTEIRPSAQQQAYDKLFAAYSQVKASYYGAYINSVTNPTPANVAYWTNMGPTLEQNVRNAYAAWGNLGYRDYVDRANGIISATLGKGPWPVYERLRQNFRMSEKKDFTTQSFWPTFAYPPKILGPDFASSWTKFTMSKGEVSTYSSRDSTSWGGGVGLSFGLFSFGGSASYTHTQERTSCNTDTFDLSVDLVTVPLSRGWMESWIFSSRGWQGGTTIGRPGSISSGDPKNLTGMMPLVPTSIVLARNLSIKLDKSKVTSSKDYSKFEKSVSAGWGPFSVRGNHISEHQSQSNDWKWNGESLEYGGTQIIAFVCEVIPKSPDPDPKYKFPPPPGESVKPLEFNALMSADGTKPQGLLPFDPELLKWLK